MDNVEQFRAQVLKTILDEIKSSPDILAAWEGGSAATNTQGQFSDIDLRIKLCF
jgi:predicted nucleotidyltransferase